MTKKKKITNKDKPEFVEIVFPEGLTALLVPITIIVGSIIIACALFFTANKFAQNSMSTSSDSVPEVAGVEDNDSDTTTQPVAGVSIDEIQELFDTENTIRFGDKNSNTLFVEISDPSCPYCSIAAGQNATLNAQVGVQFIMEADGGEYVAPVPEMRKLVKSGDASYIYFYTNGHGHGALATQALYCAHDDGKYWEVHDIIMSNEGYTLINEGDGATNANSVAKLLKSVIDYDNMLNCLENETHSDKLTRDTEIAQSLGARGTPNFFVNTEKFVGAYSFTDMQ